MNKLIIILLILSFGFNLTGFTQQQANRLLIEEYLQQSEKQKKTGVILLSTGVGATLIGTVLFGIGWGNNSDVIGGGGVLLMTAGSIATLVSIPVLIGSASSGRKAGKISLDLAQVDPLAPADWKNQKYPALSFSIPLNSQKP